MKKLSSPLALFVLLAGCSVEEIPGTQAAFDLDADLTSESHFWDMPWPSDARLEDGAPDMRGFPNPDENNTVSQLLSVVGRRPGFAMNTAGYFRFDAPIAARDVTQMIPASPSSPVLLIDLVDATLHPVVAATPADEGYTHANFLALAPRPGVILRPKRSYAYVVQRSFKDAKGELLGVPLAVRQLLEGETPAGGEEEARLWKPLLTALEKAKVSADEVAAATVFTTGDVVSELHEISEKARAKHSAEITGLVIDPDGGNHEGFCELRGHIDLPQFQKGVSPFNTEGLIEFDAEGAPVSQRTESVPVTITLPQATMPKGGWPLVLYIHGSGGDSREVVDAGPKDEPTGERRPNEGPSSVLGPLGLASASSAMPVSPERVPGASDFAYLNLQNLAAFPDLFRQGVIEQRLFIDALLKLEISPEIVDGCTNTALPEGESVHRFNAEELVGLGLSMGGMYTNMVGAVEPRIRAVAPTGAGGYWTYFILVTEMLPDPSLLAGLLGVRGELGFLHPTLQLAQTAWEWAEPFVYTPRLARRPLSGHPARPIYQPVGAKDSYFPEPILDAIALAYGNRQAGEDVWPGLQQTLAVEGREGHESYPVTDNLVSENGQRYTGVVVPYAFDGFNGHHLVFQRPVVKKQYGCFFTSFLKTGRATVVGPDGECP